MHKIIFPLLLAASLNVWADDIGQLAGLKIPCEKQANDQRFALDAAKAEYTPAACRDQVTKSIDTCLKNAEANADGLEGTEQIDAMMDPCQAADPNGGSSGALGALKTQCQNIQSTKKLALKRALICENERKKVAKACNKKDTDAGTLADTALADGSQCDQNQAKLADAQTSDVITVMNSTMSGATGGPNQDVTVNKLQSADEALSPSGEEATSLPGASNVTQKTLKYGAKLAPETPVTSFVMKNAGFAGAAVSLTQGNFTDAASSSLMSTGPIVGGAAGTAFTAAGGVISVGCTLLCPSPEPGPPECSTESGIQAAISNCNETAIASLDQR